LDLGGWDTTRAYKSEEAFRAEFREVYKGIELVFVRWNVVERDRHRRHSGAQGLGIEREFTCVSGRNKRLVILTVHQSEFK